ncbi:hypothetical protein AB0E83_32165 [Streptomyces sp. NPDC035033]|uniref:hypothetical protein n=1 Tax=Streptomyces sp. NPDC035033 TaxID=3155368 RepID=UPI0033C1C8F7
MSRASRFDQRATALVELRGLRHEHELFEEALAARGWPVLERQGREPAGFAERRVRYLIEARFPGSRFNATAGARQRIELIGDELGLDLQVPAVEGVARAPRELPRWYVYERPEAPAGTGPAARARGRFALWCAERAGTRDTGRLVTAATPQAARWLAARPLPGTPAQRGEVAVRRSLGAAPTPASGTGDRRESARLLTRLLAFALLGFVLGARLMDVRLVQGRWSWASTVLLAAAAAGAAFVLGRSPRGAPGPARAPAPGADTGSAAVGAVLVVFAAGLGAFTAWKAPDPGIGAPAILVLLLVAVVVNGLRLLVRQWSWQRVAPWLLPALIPLGFGLLPGVGTAVHVMYLDAFGVDLEDVEIPRAHQFLAMAKLTLCLSLWFLAPGLLGYMKHFHWHVRDRLFGNSVVLVVSIVLVVTGFLGAGLLAAARAGERAVAAAGAGRTPASYYGIEPEWVCLAPVGEPADVPVDGGVLDPARPYLKLGDSGGVVVVWDAGEKAALKIPLERLRVAPADSARVTCGTDGPEG